MRHTTLLALCLLAALPCEHAAGEATVGASVTTLPATSGSTSAVTVSAIAASAALVNPTSSGLAPAAGTATAAAAVASPSSLPLSSPTTTPSRTLSPTRTRPLFTVVTTLQRASSSPSTSPTPSRTPTPTGAPFSASPLPPADPVYWSPVWEAFPPWPPSSLDTSGRPPVGTAALAALGALERRRAIRGVPQGRLIVSLALPPVPVRLRVGPKAGIDPRVPLSAACVEAPPGDEDDAPLDVEAGVEGALYRCAAGRLLTVWPPNRVSFTAGDGVVFTVSTGSVLPAGGAGYAACYTALLCSIKGASTSLPEGGVDDEYVLTLPIIAIAPRLPLLSDVVIERVLLGATGGNATAGPPPLSLLSLGGASVWTPASAATAADGDAARAAAAVEASSAPPGSILRAFSLVVAATSATNLTLLSSPAAAMAGVGPFSDATGGTAAAWLERVNTSVTPAVTLPSLPVSLRPVPEVGALGAVARLTLPSRAAICGPSGACPDVRLALGITGASEDDLSALAAADAASDAFLSAVASASVLGVGAVLTFPGEGLAMSAGDAVLATPLLYASAAGVSGAFGPFKMQSAPGAALPSSSSGGGSAASPSPAHASSDAPDGAASNASAPVTTPSPSPSALPVLVATALTPVRGITYLEPCSSIQGADVVDPTTSSACLELTNPARARCAWGAGSQCMYCPPAAALCPGGFLIIPLPGYWVPSATASSPSALLACEYPSADRCPGGVLRNGQARCGRGYRQGSPGCSLCAEGYYADEHLGGVCVECPPTASLADLALPVLKLIGYLAAGMAPFALAVVVVHHRTGGTLRHGALRAIAFVQQVWLALQNLVQSTVSSPALPAATAQLFETLQVLQFQGVGPTAACANSTAPLASSIASLVFGLVLAAGLAIGTPLTARYADRNVPTTAGKVFKAHVRLPRSWSDIPHSRAACAAFWKRWSPLTLRLATLLAFLLYGRTAKIAYSLLQCNEAATTPAVYASSPTADGAALAAAGLPLDFDTLQDCTVGELASAAELPPQCLQVLGYLSAPMTVQQLASNPAVVCWEGAHRGAAGLAFASLALYGVAMPAGLLGYLWWRLRKETRRDPLAAARAADPSIGSRLAGMRKSVNWALGGGPGDPAALAAAKAATARFSVSGDKPVPLAIANDPTLQYWLHHAVYIHRSYYHGLDLLLLNLLTAAQSFLVPPRTSAAASAHIGVMLPLLAASILLILMYPPFREHEQKPIALASYTMTALCVALVYAVGKLDLAIKELQQSFLALSADAAAAAAAEAGGRDVTIQVVVTSGPLMDLQLRVDDGGVLVRRLGYLVFVGIIGLFSVIVWAFFATLIRGARKEADKAANAASAASAAAGSLNASLTAGGAVNPLAQSRAPSFSASTAGGTGLVASSSSRGSATPSPAASSRSAASSSPAASSRRSVRSTA